MMSSTCLNGITRDRASVSVWKEFSWEFPRTDKKHQSSDFGRPKFTKKDKLKDTL